MHRLPAVIMFAMLTGCASDFATKAREAGVNSIRIERRVDIDEAMRAGFREKSGQLSVALANVIVNEMYAKQISALSSNMQHHGIHVPEMVRTRAATMLTQQKGFTVVTNAGDAVLTIAVEQYGFDGAKFSLSREVPFIVLRAELTKNGERLWRGTGQAHPMRSGDLGADLKEYESNPELLRQHWQLQVERALKHLLHVK